MLQLLTEREVTEIRDCCENILATYNKKNLHPELRFSDISNKLRAILDRTELKTWEELSQYSEKEIMKWRNLGTGTLNEIILQLHIRNLKLKDENQN